MLNSLVENPLVRIGLAALTAFIVSVTFGGWLVRFFHRKDVIEDTTQPDHAGLNAVQSQKKNVPTMGGLMILVAVLTSAILWCDLHSLHVWLGLMVLVVLGGAGFVDDYIKLKKKPSRGLTKLQKLVIQFVLGGVVGYLLMRGSSDPDGVSRVLIPFGRHWWLMGYGYVLWTAFFLALMSNAVNLTDGLDGLAGGCTLITALLLAVISPMVMAVYNTDLFHEQYLDLGILSAAVAGGVMGFLWYNCHPAQIFMGDTGSLALGGLLAYVAIVAKAEIFLLIAGAVFLIDELTVALQIASFKLTKKRIFPITPIHHYFQVHRKWPEQKIVARAWIVSLLAAVLALMSLTFL